MPSNQIILFLETPRAGSEKGHRWLVPLSSRSITEAEITEAVAQIEDAEPEGKILTARRKVGQVIQGNTRDAWEMLVAAGLPTLDPHQGEHVTSLLNQSLDAFDPERVDWDSGSGLVVPTAELDALYSTLQALPTARDSKAQAPPPISGQREEPLPQKASKMKKFVLGILLASFALLAILALLPDGGDDSGSAQDDPTWNLFLSLREKSFRPSTREGHSAIEDAKYLWENVTASKWKGGDFLRTDLTRNSSEATRFLELENPESWYLANTFQNTDEAAELRAIIKAVGTRPEDESFFLREEFVKALAKSSKQLIDADLSDIDTVAVAFLEQQQAQLLDIPENNLSEWPTPADGRRATVLFETISELSRTAPPERRIRTWDDLFSEDVVSATVVAAEVNSNPVAASQWELMKPIVAWAKSIQ